MPPLLCSSRNPDSLADLDSAQCQPLITPLCPHGECVWGWGWSGGTVWQARRRNYPGDWNQTKLLLRTPTEREVSKENSRESIKRRVPDLVFACQYPSKWKSRVRCREGNYATTKRCLYWLSTRAGSGDDLTMPPWDRAAFPVNQGG